MPYDDESQRIYSYLLNLLNKKDYSEAELNKKCFDKGFENDKINLEIQGLQTKNWQNDKRLAENIVEFYSSTRGPNWISQKLKVRLIPAEIISEVLLSSPKEDVNFDEIKRAVERKYRVTDWNNIDIKTQNKVVYFLQYRGYNNVFGILNNWKNNN